MPFFPTPPVNGREDNVNVSGSVRRLVGNRNYTRQGRFGETSARHEIEIPHRRGFGLKRLFRKLLRR